MTTITFQGTLPKEAAPIVAQRLRKRQQGVAVSAWAAGLGAACALLGVLQLVVGRPEDGLSWLTLGAVLATLAGARRWSERRAFFKAVAAQVFEGTVHDEGVTLADPASETLFRWSAFEGLETHDRLLICWLKAGTALPLASSMFEDELSFEKASALIAQSQAITPERASP